MLGGYGAWIGWPRYGEERMEAAIFSADRGVDEMIDLQVDGRLFGWLDLWDDILLNL